MKTPHKLALGVAAFGVLLLGGSMTEIGARAVGGLFGDRLHIESTPRNATPDVTVGEDDAFIAGTLEVDGAARFDGTVTVPDSTITTAKLSADAVTTAKILTNAVTTSKIAASAVTTGKTYLDLPSMAALCVTTNKVIGSCSGSLSAAGLCNCQ